jgi:hypothetical protein
VSRSAQADEAANTDASRATIDRVSRFTGARYRREYRDPPWGPAPTTL